MFLLLHNCALITRYYSKKARNLCLYMSIYALHIVAYHFNRFEARYAATAFLEDLQGSVNIMLAYFHYCNQGSLPFATSWILPADIKMAHLSDEQVGFLQQTSEEISMKGIVLQLKNSSVSLLM